MVVPEIQQVGKRTQRMSLRHVQRTAEQMGTPFPVSRLAGIVRAEHSIDAHHFAIGEFNPSKRGQHSKAVIGLLVLTPTPRADESLSD